MDTLRGTFGADDSAAFDAADDAAMHDTPPAGIGQDERRMQVRAYNHWAGLLENRNFPSIEDLDPESLPDFGPYSVLLDFTAGIDNPGISYLGEKLAEECGTRADALTTLDDVPSRSLLSRITDHYMQILANQAPIGFEAEFVNQRNRTAMYRGILLPFSTDDDTIDFIYGVINWKELADQQTADELLLEIDAALEPRPARLPLANAPQPNASLTDWADGPASLLADEDPGLHEDIAADYPADLAKDSLPRPSFGMDDGMPGNTPATLSTMPLENAAERAHAHMGLADWLAEARELAAAANANEDRTRSALYGAIGHAYDFSLAAAAAPAEFADLLADAGLSVQDRAPMTPVVKLVFGADYDKTRLTEYAAALTHAHRIGLQQGALAAFLRDHDGGLKGVVKAERQLRREQSGKPATAAETPRKTLARKLRSMPAHGFEDIADGGSEFALVMIRRSYTNGVVVLGEVPDDVSLIERAARKLVS
ncbi:MAG: hypothetical protein RLZZ08_494 [Pseudomonadota bacterium]|jgi:hypothetical protein